MNTRIKIVLDDSPMNPRTHFDNAGGIIITARRWSHLGDRDEYTSAPEGSVSLPVYIRGDDSLSTEYGAVRIGTTYMDAETFAKEFDGNEERAKECLKNELELYSFYITGDVYGYMIEEVQTCECCNQDKPPRVLDSCWGFYGDSLEVTGMRYHIKEHANSLSDNWEEKMQDAWDKRFDNM